MNALTDHGPARRTWDEAPDPTGLAHRIAERQLDLGLTDEALCRRAGLTAAYLRQLLGTGLEFDPQALQRLAIALKLTSPELLEGTVRPPWARASTADVIRPRALRSP
ncbi:hypothetical protein OHV05_00905 [Kitasatospora sp. NBC_00070]|uniref:hypothetical protein n=1 Tax=Kitasatospora sp. NBC_00070 TaxID=2975962 RepID=UPI003250A868